MSQTYINIEIILINDGSPDNCGRICDEYANKDKRIIVIHKNNEGVSAARNTGIEVASGEYISFVDADDYIHPKMYETLIGLCIKNNSFISACDISYIYEDNKICKYNKTINNLSSNVLTPQSFFKEMLDSKSYLRIGVWNKIYASELIKGIQFPTDQGMAEDIVFICQVIFKTSRISYIKEPLYYYLRQREGAATQIEYGVFEEQRFLGLSRMIEYIKKNQPTLLNTAIVFKCINADIMAINKMIMANKKVPHVIAYVKKELVKNFFKIIQSDIPKNKKIQIIICIISYNIYKLIYPLFKT